MPDPSMSPLASAVRAERARRKWTQQKAASHFGVHINTVAGWEAGSGIPSSKLLPALSDWLSVDGGQLIDWIAEIGDEPLPLEVPRD